MPPCRYLWSAVAPTSLVDVCCSVNLGTLGIGAQLICPTCYEAEAVCHSTSLYCCKAWRMEEWEEIIFVYTGLGDKSVFCGWGGD